MYADPGGVAAFASRADTPFGTVGSLVMLGGMWNAGTVPKAYGGPWSAIWQAVVLAGYVLIGCRRPRREQGRERGRWPRLRHPARRPAVHRAARAGRGDRIRAGGDVVRAAQAVRSRN